MAKIRVGDKVKLTFDVIAVSGGVLTLNRPYILLDGTVSPVAYARMSILSNDRFAEHIPAPWRPEVGDTVYSSTGMKLTVLCVDSDTVFCRMVESSSSYYTTTITHLSPDP